MSTSPAAPRPGAPGFLKLIDAASLELAEFRRSATHALRTGVIPTEILAYARGGLPAIEHRETQAMLAKSEWAMGRVVALVKARRDPSSLGSRILAAEVVDPSAFGIAESGDPDADLAALLDRV